MATTHRWSRFKSRAAGSTVGWRCRPLARYVKFISVPLNKRNDKLSEFIAWHVVISSIGKQCMERELCRQRMMGRLSASWESCTETGSPWQFQYSAWAGWVVRGVITWRSVIEDWLSEYALCCIVDLLTWGGFNVRDTVNFPQSTRSCIILSSLQGPRVRYP